MNKQESALEGGKGRQDTSRTTRLAPRQPNYFAKSLLLLVSIAGSLALAEFAIRLHALVTHQLTLFVSDEKTGWALAPNLREQTKVEAKGQYVLSTDEEGHRRTRRADESLLGINSTVILVGDSFVQGQAVDDSATFAWVLAHETSRNVINLGVSGFGTDQELISLKAYLEAHPTLEVNDIVVFVYENDFRDVENSDELMHGHSKPRFRLKGGRLESDGYRPSVSDRLIDVSHLYRLCKQRLFKRRGTTYSGHGHSDLTAASDLVIACLSAMRDLAAQRGARFHVLAHRSPGQHPKVASFWTDFVHRSGAVDITPRLFTTNGPDPRGYDHLHWSAAGHRLVASILEEVLGSK